jgi:hypothetical protein
LRAYVVEADRRVETMMRGSQEDHALRWAAEARLARVAGVLADLRGRLTPSADFLADQIAAAIAPQDDTPPAARRGEE